MACGLLFIGMGAHREAIPVEGQAAMPGWQVDLDSATSVELQLLPGVGPVLAQRIIHWRDSGHHLRRVEDLDAITGFGPRTIERLRPHVAGGDGPLPGEFTTTE